MLLLSWKKRWKVWSFHRRVIISVTAPILVLSSLSMLTAVITSFFIPFTESPDSLWSHESIWLMFTLGAWFCSAMLFSVAANDENYAHSRTP